MTAVLGHPFTQLCRGGEPGTEYHPRHLPVLFTTTLLQGQKGRLTVHHRHVEIHQQHAMVVGRKSIQRLGTIARNFNTGFRKLPGQYHAEELLDDLFVIHNQYTSTVTRNSGHTPSIQIYPRAA